MQSTISLLHSVEYNYDAIPVPEELKGSVLKQAGSHPKLIEMSLVLLILWCFDRTQPGQCDDCSSKPKVEEERLKYIITLRGQTEHICGHFNNIHVRLWFFKNNR